MAANEDVVAAGATTDNQNKRKLEDSDAEPPSGAVEPDSAADDGKQPAQEDVLEAKRPRLGDGHCMSLTPSDFYSFIEMPLFSFSCCRAVAGLFFNDSFKSISRGRAC